jgi:crotonobetaine/carnitine-CoA ligase
VGRDLAWLIDAQAQQRAQRTFLIWAPFVGEGQSWTFAEFAAETRAVAQGLAARGVKAGDFVTLHLDNCPEFLIAWCACARLGAVAVTTNTRSTADELAFFLTDSASVAAITQPKYVALVQGAGPALRLIFCTETDCGEAAASLSEGVLAYASLKAECADFGARAPQPLAQNNVIYTSGTTSRPKGVVWTHANALWIASTTALHYRLTERDVHPIYLPLFHTNALGLSFLSMLWAGGTVVLSPKFSARRFWDIAAAHRCTWAQMTWFILRAIAELPDPPSHDFRFWAAAGDMGFVRDRWGVKTLGIYGMTETVGLCVSSALDLTGPEGAMGRVRPEWEVALRRPDGGDVAQGEAGNIWVRGAPGLSLFQEYLNNPEATAAAFDADGWLDTGDTAVLHASGDLFFAGRAKDMLKVGGENVAALEIEAVIARVPGVVESAVVGKPDRMLDEVPVAFVVADRPGAALEQAINAACAEMLSDFKRPREIRFVDALPKGVLDKILKNELRAVLDAEAPVRQRSEG